MGAVYTIVRASEGHLDALPAIELAAAQLFDGLVPATVPLDTTDPQQFLEAARHGHLWVALANGEPVGFAHVEMLGPSLPHLEELDVHPSHGRRGIGTALVRAVCEWAESEGHAPLTLTTFRHVPFNMPFYARLGFLAVPPTDLGAELASKVANEAARGCRPRYGS